MENTEQTQEQFINLLLKKRNVLDKWEESALTPNYFSPQYRFLITTIIKHWENRTLLTLKSYRVYLKNLIVSRIDRGHQEMLYNKCFMLNTSVDDYPTLLNQIREIYLGAVSKPLLQKFEEEGKTKSILVALRNLQDALDDLPTDETARTKIIYQPVNAFLNDFVDHAKKVRDGTIKEEELIKTGIDDLDYVLTAGLPPGNLVLFIGDVGGGKSTMMLNVAMNVWKNGKNVLYVSLEMPWQQVIPKMMSNDTRIPYDVYCFPKKWTPEQAQKVEDTQKQWDERCQKSQFYFTETSDRVKVSTIRREIEKHLQIFKPDVVVVDYIANLIPDKNRESRNDLEIGDMLKDLRAMGRNMGFCVISGAQIGRDALKRIRKSDGDKVTINSEDIRGSQEYPADADAIFALFKEPTQPNRLWHLFIVKMRFGRPIFQNNTVKTTLEVEPECCLIKNRENWLKSDAEQEMTKMFSSTKVEVQDDLKFDDDDEYEKKKRGISAADVFKDLN